ncbi:DUF3037 domain-containing protein [Formosa sp. S-31]|uniref:DUF3037 domain-containing protein n=1 Tax=Formosa sp. S-31 TaxID=2790949 RepID=UPI003EBE273C
MQEKILYEYAVIRYLPQVEREEFVNLGVVLYSKSKRCVKIEYHLDTKRLMAFSKAVDIDLVREHLNAFTTIALGTAKRSVISELDEASRFRWLTAVRSSVIQTSRPHPGFSYDLDKTIKTLMQELVL